MRTNLFLAAHFTFGKLAPETAASAKALTRQVRGKNYQASPSTKRKHRVFSR